MIDYQGEWIRSYVDGGEIIYFPSSKRQRRICFSVLSITTLVLLVISVVVGIYLMRFYLSVSTGGPLSDSNAQTMASIANAVQIQVMSYLYTFIANALTDHEQHRTQTYYEDSLIIKIFLFQFVNCYASFFYLAFAADIVGDCGINGCMESLSINLAIIYGSRLATGNVLGLIMPYITYQFRYRHLGKVDGITRPEKEYLLQQYDEQGNNIADYADVTIQFGYTAMFVSALPLAASFAYISNIINTQGNAWKLLNIFQRPIPKGAEDIGNWQTIFLMLSIAAVITNAGITIFTMTVLDQFSIEFRFWVFIGFQWTCFTCQVILFEYSIWFLNINISLLFEFI
jgi:hypothetical protein